MGFLSKKKEEPAPMPPAPQSLNMVAPPMPEAPTSSNLDSSGIPAPEMSSAGEIQVPGVPSNASLSPPPMPGGNLNDIKKEIIGDNDSNPELNLDSDDEMDFGSSSDMPSSSDDLFNMFKMDESHDDTALVEESTDESPSFEEPNVVDTSMEHLGHNNYGFDSRRKGASDSTFLTTTQFKALLGIVDSVKGKVKESSETHLRLLDMKAEEDIEYESLRKSFQFIEDQLYELDGILFEK